MLGESYYVIHQQIQGRAADKCQSDNRYFNVVGYISVGFVEADNQKYDETV